MAEGETLWFGIMNHQDEMIGHAVIECINERMGNAQLQIHIFEGYIRVDMGGMWFELLWSFFSTKEDFIGLYAV